MMMWFSPRSRSLIPWLFLLPALAILGLTVFFPAAQAFYLSFTQVSYSPLDPPQWVGWTNFRRLWGDPVFWQTVRNTWLYLVGVVPPLVFLSLALAILVNRPLRAIAWFRGAFYTPVVISLVIAGIAWKALFASQGLLNATLTHLGGVPIPWLTSPQWAIWSVMAVTLWKGLGYYMVIYLAGLQSIPAELYEAAALDGCDGWRRHWYITLPLMRPYVFLVSVISAIAATKVFEEVFILTQGGPLNASKTVVFYLYEQAFKNSEFSYGCTIGLLLFLGIFILSLINLSLVQGKTLPKT